MLKFKINPNPIIKTISRGLPYLGVLILSPAVMLICYVGLFQRPIADDFCTLSVVAANGYWGTLFKYFGIRYGSSIFSYFIALFGAQSFQFLVMILFVILVLFCYLLLRLLTKIAQSGNMIKSILLAETLFAGLFLLTPKPSESLYWFGASIVYTWPLLFIFIAILFGGFVLSNNNKKLQFSGVIILFILTYFTFGFSESLAFAFLPITVGLVILSVVKRHNKALLAASILFANIFSIVTMYLLPARVQRAQMYKDAGIIFKPTIQDVVVGSLQGALSFFKTIVITPQYLVITVFIFVISFFVFYGQNSFKIQINFKGYINKLIIFLFFLVLPFSVWFCLIPGYYVFPDGPPSRSFVTMVFLFIAYVFMFAFVFAAYIKQLNFDVSAINLRTKILVVMLVCALVTAGSLFIYKNHRYSLSRIYSKVTYIIDYNKKFAYNYDLRERYILEQKKTGKVLIEFPSIVDNESPERNMTTESSHWINVCAANYYGVKKLKLVSQ